MSVSWFCHAAAHFIFMVLCNVSFSAIGLYKIPMGQLGNKGMVSSVKYVFGLAEL